MKDKRALCIYAYANSLCDNECEDCPVDFEEVENYLRDVKNEE